MSRTLPSALAGVALLATACSPGTRSPYTPAPASSVDVVVDNQFVEDVHVYLLRGEGKILLGTVGSFERRTFRVGQALLPLLEPLRLRVRSLGGQSFTAEPVLADRGDRVLWRLGPRLELSSMLVREVP